MSEGSLHMSDAAIKAEQNKLVQKCYLETANLFPIEHKQKAWVACINKGDREIAEKDLSYCLQRVVVRRGGADCFFVYGGEGIPENSKYGYYHNKRF